jgi:hypothetical protein
MKIEIKLKRPVCRTPIKPAQKHKIATKYSRQAKHREKIHHETY